MRRLRVTLLAAVLAVAAGGCGEEPSAERAGEPPVASAPAEPVAAGRPASKGLRTHAVGRAGFSVAVPESWRTASAEDVFSRKSLARMSRQVPLLAPALASLGTDGSLVQLVAYDPDAPAAFATNLNVVVEPLPGRIERERYFRLTLAQLTRLFGPDTHFVEQRVELPAGLAMRLSYEAFTAPAGPLTTTQYVFFRRQTGYVLTYTTLSERLAEDERDFERSARSFALL